MGGIFGVAIRNKIAFHIEDSCLAAAGSIVSALPPAYTALYLLPPDFVKQFSPVFRGDVSKRCIPAAYFRTFSVRLTAVLYFPVIPYLLVYFVSCAPIFPRSFYFPKPCIFLCFFYFIMLFRNFLRSSALFLALLYSYALFCALSCSSAFFRVLLYSSALFCALSCSSALFLCSFVLFRAFIDSSAYLLFCTFRSHRAQPHSTSALVP